MHHLLGAGSAIMFFTGYYLLIFDPIWSMIGSALANLPR